MEKSNPQDIAVIFYYKLTKLYTSVPSSSEDIKDIENNLSDRIKGEPEALSLCLSDWRYSCIDPISTNYFVHRSCGCGISCILHHNFESHGAVIFEFAASFEQAGTTSLLAKPVANSAGQLTGMVCAVLSADVIAAASAAATESGVTVLMSRIA